MNKIKRLIGVRTAAAMAVAVLLAAAANAEAGNIANLQLMGWGPHAPGGPSVTLHDSSGAAITTDALTYGGAFLWNTFSGSAGTLGGPVAGPGATITDFVTPASGNALLTFCLELNQNIGFGSQYYAEILSLDQLPSSGAPPGPSPNLSPTSMGTTSSDLIARLWAAFFDSKIATPSSDLATYGGAFQLAIWKLEYDSASLGGSFDKNQFNDGFLTLSPGDITAYSNGSTGIVDYAADWIDQVLKHPTWGMANLRGLRLVDLAGNPSQDQVGQLIGPNIQSIPTPEPASVAIWFVVGAALAFPKLRRRRTASTTDVG